MKPLDIVKAKFLSIFPVEENVRERRFALAGYKCEMCQSTYLLELHHSIWTVKKKRLRKGYKHPLRV
jgi:transposase-like protein